MMVRALGVVLLMHLPLQVPLSNVGQGGDSELKTWAGKTVVLTAHPPAHFMSFTRPMVSMGVLGIAAAAVQGKEIIEQNHIENPALQLVKALFDAAKTAYDLKAASPLPVDSTDAASVARVARGADLVFDVHPLSWSLEPRLMRNPWQKHHYYVTQEIQFRVIDVASARILRDGKCVRTTQTQADPLPTRDELLADHAKGLRSVLDAQRDFCIEYFEITVLGLPSPRT